MNTTHTLDVIAASIERTHPAEASQLRRIARELKDNNTRGLRRLLATAARAPTPAQEPRR